MKKSGTLIFGIIGWVIAIIIFFPIFWMTITAFKTERGAYSPDLIFMPTLESFRDVFARSNYLAFVLNSIYVSIGSTLVCFLFAIPAAYKMSFFPTLKTQGRLLWMLSTKMMPAVGVLVEYSGSDKEAAHAVALQIAALRAKYLTRDDVPEDVVANERRIAEETARNEGKPEQALPKIVDGRLNGFFKDVVLLDQPSVSDSKKTVKALLDEAGVTVTRFVRFEVGQA